MIASLNLRIVVGHGKLILCAYQFHIFFVNVCLVDYVCGGELFTHLHQRGRFNEHEGMFYIGEITLALECLHAVSGTV